MSLVGLCKVELSPASYENMLFDRKMVCIVSKVTAANLIRSVNAEHLKLLMTAVL